MSTETHVPTALHSVNAGHKQLADYRSVLPAGMFDEITALADTLKGKRVLHLSATAFGGGVAEIMYTFVPLMNDLGVDTHWRIIHGAEPFYDVTKLMHNSLQGAPEAPNEEQQEIWWEYQRINAQYVDPDEWDVIVIHDPQPLGLRALLPGGKAKWVWRCHIDLSTPNPDMVAFALPEINRYDATLFHREEYVPSGLDTRRHIVPPAIDPLAPKNMALSSQDAQYIVGQFGLDIDRPMLLQVSRFDPWKDPLGVIDAYRIVKEKHPDVQLALIGSMAHDDPEGWEYYEATMAHADGDSDIHILSNFSNVGAVEVNAFQVCADAVLQKSLKEGFGLTVTEALWKGRPTIGGNVGGIRSQIQHGETGWLVDSVDEAAQACLEALEEVERSAEMARAGKEYVRSHFLTPRYVRDHLAVYAEALGAE